jgi:hypothetical protein
LVGFSAWEFNKKHQSFMESFWNTITAPFKAAAEKTKKTIGDFFAPVPDQVRTRDFVRELPVATEKVGQSILNFSKDVLRAAPRAAASATLSAEGQKEFIPGTGVAPKFEKFLFGEKPIKDIRGTGEETIQTFGGSEDTAKKYGLPLGFALTAFDIVPGIPKKKTAEEIGEQLVRRYGDDVAKMIMEKGGKSLAEQTLKEGGEKLLKEAGIDLVKVAEPIEQTVKNVEEVIKGVKSADYFEKEGRNLMEFENADLSLPEIKRKLEIATEGKDDEMIGSIKNDIAARESELLDAAKADGVQKLEENLYHGTTKENAESIMKNGIDTSLNTKGFAEAPDSFYAAPTVNEASMYGDSILNVKPKQEVKTLSVTSQEWADTVGKSRNAQESKLARDELRKRGYDAVHYGDEVEILNPEKFQVTGPRNLTSNAEEALDAINEKGSPVIKEGKKIAPESLRADEVAPPATPPRIPDENPLADSSDVPKGSALDNIDNMTGKTGQTKNLLEWMKNAPKKFTEAFSDRFAPIKRFEEMVSDMAGKPIDINSSAYIGARMYAGRMGTVEAYLGDLQKILSPLNKERADFTRFVLSRRALERAERGFENPAGVTADTAKQAMEELNTKVGPEIFNSFETAEQSIQKWADENILKPATESGIISQKVYDSVIEKNRHWMPFHVIDELPDPAVLDKMPRGTEIFSVNKQGIIHELEGTEKIIRDPFDSIIDKLSNAVNLIKRNEVAQKLINIREVMPEAKEFIKPLEKSESAPKGWGSISVFADGKNTKWIVPEELSWAMHQMNEVEAGILGNFVKFTSAAFRKGATTLYIPFSLSNAVRDAQMAVMSSKYGFNPVDWVKGFAEGLKGAFGWDSKLIDEFGKNGGGFGGFIQSAKEISGVKNQLFEPTWWKKTKAVINPFNLVTNFAEATELAPRLGVYKRALKSGASGLEAAYEARNATIDFAKSGQEMRIINMWVPFVNARWQALLNTARIFKDSPVKASAKAGALIITPGVTTYFWNAMNYPDLYEDVPRWIKDTYFPIIVGEDKDQDGNRIPKMVLIPKGDVGQIFYNPIEYALDYVRKGEPSNFTKLALEWMSQLAPIPFTRDGELSATQFLSGALPPVLRTPAELATNKSFFTNGPVVPRRLEQVAPTEQYDAKTPYAAVVIGRALGVSPMKLAYGLNGLLGGFGREAIDPAKILQTTAERFYRAEGGEKRNQAWNLKDETVVGYNTAREQAKRAIEANDMQTATGIIDNWNAQAEKILPDILPYLAQDDPQEAQKLRSTVTFQMQDIARLQKSVYDKISEDTSKGTTQTSGSPATMGQMFPNQGLGQSDLKQMRQASK